MDGTNRRKGAKRWLKVGVVVGAGAFAAYYSHGTWPNRTHVASSSGSAGRERSFVDGERDGRNPVTVSSKDGRLTLHDCGSVMAGDRLRHVFTFRNPFPYELKLNAESDVRKSCGCTTASLAHHHLARGQSTTLAMEVDTHGKRGLVHEVVGVAWTDDQGRRHEYGYALRGTINVAIVCRPHEMTFSATETAEGTVKRVECASDLAVDWSRAVLDVSSPDLEVVGQTVSENNRLQIDLRRRDGGGTAFQTSQMSIQVPRRASDDTNDRELKVQTVEGELLVFSHHRIGLSVMPRFPCFRANPQDRAWSGRLIIKGESIKESSALQAMESPDGMVSFRAVTLGPGALQADVTLTPRTIRPEFATTGMPLVIRMTSGQEIQIVVQLREPV